MAVAPAIFRIPAGIVENRLKPGTASAGDRAVVMRTMAPRGAHEDFGFLRQCSLPASRILRLILVQMPSVYSG